MDISTTDLELELARRKELPHAAEDVRVTVLIPCKNAWKWLARSLWWLEKGAQSLPMRLHTAEQGSTDVTPLVLQKLGDELQMPYSYLGPVADHGDPMRNMCHIRWALADSVETEYALFLDADVCLPIGAARTMVEMMDEMPKLGLLGIPYARSTDHVKMGCTMMRRDVLQVLKWSADPCECAGANKAVKELGYEVAHLAGWWARDLKQELGG